MNYELAMKYIHSMHKFGSNYGTKRTEKILELLGNPQKKIKCIHIAGTNGKGSTTAMISKILISAGYKVGMYTSPFIEDFEERIQINDNKISKEDLSRIVATVKTVVDKVFTIGYEHPTEFEIITCCMFLYFCEQNVDFAVVEVGLGGRQDSTNVINPLACVISSISFDHMDILGKSLVEIATEKAGIIKNNTSVVVYPQEDAALNVIKGICEEKNANMIVVDEHCVKDGNSQKNSSLQNFTVKTKSDEYDVYLNLLGVHQKLNCATVIHLIEVLKKQGIKIEKEHILQGLRDVKWLGRLEIMNKNPLVVIDGAHNIDGVKNLTNSIKEYFSYKKLILILGILADKQVNDMVNMISPLASRVIAVSPHSNRAKGEKELFEIIKTVNSNCEAIEDYQEAYEKALSYCEKDDMILVAGSLYLIGDMRKVIRKHNKNN